MGMASEDPGFPPYLVAIGAGAAEVLHRILGTGPIILARTREAGVALGHNADVWEPCQANHRVSERPLLPKLCSFSTTAAHPLCPA